MSYNKFKNTEIKDVNNLGYALTTTGNIICNGTSTINGTTNINSNLNVTGLPFFIASSNALPTATTGGNAGLSLYWNVTGNSYGETAFLNYAQGGSGGFSFYSANAYNAPKWLAYLDSNSNLSKLNNISCSFFNNKWSCSNWYYCANCFIYI